MAFTKFKSLTERLLSGLGRSKTFFPFYDSQNDADYRVSLDTLITFISNELGVSSKAVFELTGVTNTGNNYISTLDISSYRTEGLYIFKPSADSDNTSSLNVNSVGILDIKEFDGTDLVDKTDLKAVNTYLLLNKTSYWLVVGGVSGGSGGVSTFSALTDSPYDNPLLSAALDSKQDRLAGIVSGCEITVETFVGVGTNKQIRVTSGTWYIPTSEHAKATDTVSAEITLCPTGGDFKYYDIVADTSGAITIHEGTPSTAPAHYVIIDPLTQVLLGFITVGDAVIEEPVPIVSGFIPLTGTSAMTGSFNSPPAIYPSGRYSSGLLYGQIETVLSQITDNPAGDTRIYENKVRVHYNGIASEVLDRLDPSKDRIFSVLRGTKFVFTGDIAVYIGLTHAEIAAKIDADPYALITRQYFEDNSSSLTQSSQAQVEAAFDNTDQTTPVVLEQTSALTPFNAWWLVQKIKTWVRAGFTLTGALNFAPSVSLTGATPAIGAASSNNITITSATTITGFDTIAEGTIRRVKFAAVTPLTHSANLDLPTSANITTSVGDEAVFRSNGSGSWKCIDYTRKSGSSLIGVTPINNSQNTAVLFWENGIGEDLAGFYYDRTNKILNLKGTLPTIRLINADGTYSALERSVTANTFKLKNQVLQAGGIGKAISFNGTTQYGTAVGSSIVSTSSSALSISCWCKFPSAQSFAQVIVTVAGINVIINGNVGAGTVTVGVATNLGTVNDSLNLLDGNWHHIVLANGAANYTLYIDGNLRSSNSGTPTTTNGTLIVSNIASGRALMHIDQLLIWNVKLTAGEINSLYNSGAGNATIPQTANLKRRYEIEEGTGSTINDTSGNSDNITLFNSPTWLNIGKVPVVGSSVEATILESVDGATNGERGVTKFGEFNATNIFQGKYLKFLVDIYYFFVTDNTGNVLIDSSNTSSSAAPTAKLTVGASTALIAGFRFIAGVLNTSSINLGDFNHITSQRTIFKRKGATTANSLWLSESDIHFTQTDTKTVVNTVTATSLIGTLVTGQTLTFPADFWVAGKMEEIEIEGVLSNVITDTLLIDVTLGGTNISTSSANTLGAAYTNTRFKLTLKIKCETVGASGTFRVTGEFRYTTALGVESVWSMTKVGTTTINTTTTLALDVKATWGAASASNTITSYNSKGLILN